MQTPSYRALQAWLKRERQEAGRIDKWTDGIQKRIQSWVPDRIQDAITKGMSGFTRLVMTGSGVLLPDPGAETTLEGRELLAQKAVDNYVHLGMISGAGTSAGGILTGLLDLPFLMSFKIKLIFEIGSHFGYDLKDPRERYYALLVFREAFSNSVNRRAHLDALIAFESTKADLSDPLNQIDWQAFQQEYRDYLDLAKLLQFIPAVGIVIGAAVNRRLILHLGETAINAYRLRYFQRHPERRQL